MQFANKQAASSIRLADGTVLTECDQCRQMYAERNPPEEPPCETCRVIPMPENADAFRIFFLVQHQLILSMGGVVDINHLAIHAAMDLYQIQNKQKCFEKVLKICRWWVSKMNEKKDDEGGKK